jgi:hypothetical protein
MTLEPAGNHTFTEATAGYTTSPIHSRTVRNTGNQPTGALSVALTGTNANSFQLRVPAAGGSGGTWSAAGAAINLSGIAAPSGTRAFEIRPVAGLAHGTHTATVTVSSELSQIANRTFTVTFVVNRAPLTGTATITGFNHIGGTITANTTAVGGSGAFSYQWTADNVPIAGATSATFVITGAQAGRTIRVVVSRADNTESITSAPLSGGVVPFNFVLTQTGYNWGYDLLMVSGGSTVREGDIIPIVYLLSSGGTANSSLTFTGAAGLPAITAPGEGRFEYTVRAADAVDGIITINAIFTHTDLALRTLTFANENHTARFGDAPFTNTATVSAGTGTITYASSNADVATVNSNGRVTITGVGAATITATIAATSAHVSATASFNVTVNRAAPPSAPEGLTSTAPTASDVNDGTISGVTQAMEFRAVSESPENGVGEESALFTAVEGTVISNLSSGKYEVRFAATDTHEASAAAEITVGDFIPPEPDPCEDCDAHPCECPEPPEPPRVIRFAVEKPCDCCLEDTIWSVTRFTQREQSNEDGSEGGGELIITERWAVKRDSDGKLTDLVKWMTRTRQCAVSGDTLFSYVMCFESGNWTEVVETEVV